MTTAISLRRFVKQMENASLTVKEELKAKRAKLETQIAVASRALQNTDMSALSVETGDDTNDWVRRIEEQLGGMVEKLSTVHCILQGDAPVNDLLDHSALAKLRVAAASLKGILAGIKRHKAEAVAERRGKRVSAAGTVPKRMRASASTHGNDGAAAVSAASSDIMIGWVGHPSGAASEEH